MISLGETKHLINNFTLSCETLLKEWLEMWSQPFSSFLWSLAYGNEFQIPNLKFSDWSKDLIIVCIDFGSKQSLDQSEKLGIQNS